MPKDEHIAILARGAAAWNAWRADRDETPDLSRAGLRGVDLSGFDLSGADLRGADLRGTNLSGANLSEAHLDGANFFKAVLDRADFAGAFLNGAQFLELHSAHSHQELAISVPRYALACGAVIPDRKPAE